jgi:hypothetical protein
MAYSEIGKVATQTELSFVLQNLVDFLGHNNSFIAALAYRETLAIAAEHGQSTWQMFSPFWPSISIKVIEQMKSRPQILQRLAEILEIRDSVFLTRTQNFTVPVLVLGRHRDVLEQMSQKMGVRMWEMLKINMPFILAQLFTQDKRRTETGIEFLVSLMAANKTGAGKPTIDTKSLIFSSRTPLTIELLKMLASESDAKREHVFHALQTVAMYVSEKPIQDAKGTKAQEYLKIYLQNNILELMNHFTDIITDKRGRKTFTEKIGCIAGIQEIIRFAAAASKAALPQVLHCQCTNSDYCLLPECIDRRCATVVSYTSLGNVGGKHSIRRSWNDAVSDVCGVCADLAAVFGSRERLDQNCYTRRGCTTRTSRHDGLLDSIAGRNSRTRENCQTTRRVANESGATIGLGIVDSAVLPRDSRDMSSGTRGTSRLSSQARIVPAQSDSRRKLR